MNCTFIREPDVIRRLKNRFIRDQRIQAADEDSRPLPIEECRRRLELICGRDVLSCFQTVTSAQPPGGRSGRTTVALLLFGHLPIQVELDPLQPSHCEFWVGAYDIDGRGQRPIARHCLSRRVRANSLSEALVIADQEFRHLQHSRQRLSCGCRQSAPPDDALPEEAWLYEQLEQPHSPPGPDGRSEWTSRQAVEQLLELQRRRIEAPAWLDQEDPNPEEQEEDPERWDQ